jgi:hypothetical protein
MDQVEILLREDDVGFPRREQLRLSRGGYQENACCSERFEWEWHN